MKKLLILGAGKRGNIYSSYAKKYKNDVRVVAVAEKDVDKLKEFSKRYNVSHEFQFNSWEKALDVGKKIADAVIITLPDKMHHNSFIQSSELGYDILLEKPIARTLEKSIDIVEQSRKHRGIVAICHVLRYSSFYENLKKMIDKGFVGEVVTAEHLEAIGAQHFAHSYVRGNWRKEDESGPSILTKSCHDMDILFWLIGKKPKKISSFGSLKHFTSKNAPEGSSKRCMDCGVEKTCPYSAKKIYYDKRNLKSPTPVITSDLSRAGVTKALEEGPYGRCVYRCDNDVADHQVVNILFENDVTASFTMSAFTNRAKKTINGHRKTRVMGTHGELIGDFRHIEHVDFRSGKTKRYDTNKMRGFNGSLHGGGDFGIMADFIKAISTRNKKYLTSTPQESLMSHRMAFAAEESRKNNKVINM